MRRLLRMVPTITAGLILIPCITLAATPNYDYYSANRTLIRNGVQAVLMCNGLFTSKRSLEQVFARELAYLTGRLGPPVGTPGGR